MTPALILRLLNPQSHQPELDASSIVKCFWPLLPLYPLWKSFFYRSVILSYFPNSLLLPEGSVLGLLPVPCTVSLCELTHSRGFGGFIFLISTSSCPQLKISLPNQPHGHCLLCISLLDDTQAPPAGPHPNRTNANHS